MNWIDIVVEVLHKKPAKFLLSKPTKDSTVWVCITDKHIIIRSKSRFRDVGIYHYVHDLTTGEFLHTYGNFYTLKFDRVTIDIYNQFVKAYTI